MHLFRYLLLRLARPVALALVAFQAAVGVPSSHAQSAPIEPGQTFTARVVEITDGDTYDVERSIGGKVTIRLHGVDAPESNQPFGRKATRRARQLLRAKTSGSLLRT